MLTHEQAAAQMGMAVREIIDVREVGDSHVVTTHDEVQMIIHPDGRMRRYTEPLPAAEPVEQQAEGEGGQSTPDGTGGQGQGHADGAPPAGLPEGTAEQVLEWVAEDVERARLALAAEQARPKPRAGLTAALEKVIG